MQPVFLEWDVAKRCILASGKDTLMSSLTDSTRPPSPPDTDLAAAVQRVLAASSEPLTVSKIRSRLPSPFRNATLEELSDYLQRQVSANVLYQFPKYRSQQDRFWDRPM